MDGVGSFGAGRTGSTVDPITFAKQPQTILRVLSWVRAGFHGAAGFVYVCVNVCAGGAEGGGVLSVVVETCDVFSL